MHVVWGIVLMVAGLLMLTWGTTRSEFVIYRILVERSKSLWGEKVHRFYQFSGLAMIAVGVLVALNIIGG